MNKVSGVTLYLVGFLLLFFAFVLVRYECMLQFMCTRLVFIMFVAHVCVLVFDVSLFCVTSAKRGVRSLFSRSRVRAVRGAILLLLLPSRRTRRITFRLRIANRVGEDSRCRGGIVNTRGGCSRALLERRPRPKALWRFRASTSNSLSDRSRLPTHTHTRQIDHTYAQQDIRVCEDDHFKPPNWQSRIPRRFRFFA